MYSEVKDTVYCLYVLYIARVYAYAYTHRPLATTISLHSRHSDLHIPISVFRTSLIKRLKDETGFVILVFFLVAL